MLTFLKTVFLIILIYNVLKFFLKLFMPKIMSYLMKRLQQKVTNTHSPEQELNPKSKSKPSKTKVGEYIDYEEIE